MRRNAKRFETWKRLFAVLIICAMMFSNVSGTIRAVEGQVEEPQASSEQTIDEAPAEAEAASDAVEKENTPSEEPATEEQAPAEPDSTEQTPVDPKTPAQEEEVPSNDSQEPAQEETPVKEEEKASEPEKAAEETPAEGETTPAEAEETPEKAEEPIRAAEGETKAEAETWTVTFYDRDADPYKTVQVEKGKAIGDQMPETIARDDYDAYWAIGEIVEGGQGQQISVIGPRIDETWKPEADTTIVPDYDEIVYTVTFYQEDKTTVVDTKTVTYGSNYCVNDLPAVPTKTGSHGKWVYSDGDFSNMVRVDKNADENRELSVWAEYDQTVFNVTFKVEGEDYKTDKYYYGDELTVPKAPVVEGKEFVGWFIDDTQYVGGEQVKSDLTITAKFDDEFYVNFIVKHDDETEERLSQYFRTTGEAIGTMPQDPFVAGKVFEKWVIQGTDTEVTADTVVTGNMTVEAVFQTIDIYNITAEYYYVNDRGEKVIFNTDLLQAEGHELPYQIDAPATTQTDPNEVAGAPIYYPETPSVSVTESMFDADKKATVRFKYVSYTAEYDFVYKVKDLTGNGYTEIPDSREHVYGVLNSYVTPTVKTFDNYVLEVAQGANITQASGQELEVKYSRKNYQLTYDSKGGSFVSGVTVPYGTQQAVTSEAPTRAGYTFAGWYLDEDCTQAAGSTVTVNGNTTLYAKWTGDNVNYTIVYMFEKYNDAGTASDYVYDNSRDATAAVGSTVQASSAPSITRKGWEVDTAKNATSSVEIAADGSSVLYVYYKLTEYEFHFRPGVYYYNNYNTYDVTASLNGQSRRGNNNWPYTFKAKLGQDISSLWISAGNGTYDRNGWRYNVSFSGWTAVGGDTVYVTKRLTLTEDMLPASGTSITYEGYWLSSTVTYTVNYMLQNADDNNYTRSETYSQTYNYSSGASLNPKDIPGYTYVRRTDSGNTSNLYYDRDKFKIDYYYGSTKLDTIENVKFDANINKAPYVWTPTAAQCGVDSDYTFDGWYADSGLTSKYTFSTMPASNLVLYAKWNAPSFTVSFNTDGGSSVESQTVEKYKTASAPETNPTKDGYNFEGWFTSPDGTDLFQWNTQITEDTTVYAHWSRKTLTYTVRYLDEEDNPVANDKVVTNPNYTVGQEITEHAIAVASYRPEKNSDTLILSGTDSDNVIIFRYSRKTDLTSYTVKYVIADGETGAGTAVAAEKRATDIPGDTASVIELAAAVDYDALYAEVPELEGVEFYPDEVEKTLVLSSDVNQNVLTFYYSSYKNVKVTVNYVDMNGDPIPGITADPQVLKVGKTFTLARTPINGWELNKAVSGTAYSGDEAGDSYKITQAMADNGENLEFTLFYQKKATITAKSLSKQYDGTELKLPAAINGQVDVEGLLEDDSLTSVAFNYANTDNTTNDGRINAGTATVTPKNAVISGNGTNPDYYTIRYISGTLEVTKINVTVRIEPDRWTNAPYTGEPYLTGFTNPSKGVEDYIIISHAGYKTAYLNDIWDAVKTKATYDEAAAGLQYYGIDEKDAGDYDYDINLTLADLPQNDNYSVSLFVRPGRLQILPADLTVTTGTAEKPYDGTPLTKDEASLTGLVEADQGKVTIAATGTITDPGSVSNSYKITWGEVNPNNYTIKKNLGTLTVTEAVLNITVDDKTVTYNGKEQSGYSQTDTEKYTVTGLADGHTLNIEYTPAKGTNAGTYENGEFAETFTVTDEDDKDVTEFYKLGTLKPGKLTIEKAALTITANDQTYTYNGSAQGENNATYTDTSKVKVEGLKGQDKLTSIKLNGQETNAGEYADKIVASNAVIGEATGNYTITYVPGKLTIEKATLTITANDQKYTYNGSPQGENNKTYADTSKVTVNGLMGQDALTSITLNGQETNAGVYDKKIVASEAAIGDATDNYEITYVPGKLTIEKAALTITANDQKYTYNGSAQGENNATYTDASKVTVTGLKGNDALTSITLNGQETNVGEYAGKIVPSAAEIGEATANYEIEYVAGKLTIEKKKVTITVADSSKVFNTADPAFTGIVEGLVHEDDLGTITYSRTNDAEAVGTYPEVLDATYTENANYDVTVIKGDFEITISKALTVTATGYGGVYDGAAHAASAIALIDGQPAEGVTIEYKVGDGAWTTTAPSIKDVGEQTVSVRANKTGYTEATDECTLKVTPKEVTITVANDKKVYGAEDPNFAKAAMSGQIEGELTDIDLTVSRTNTDENVGTYKGVLAISKTKAELDAAYTNYTFIVGTGDFEITKATLTITVKDQTYTYNGSAQGEDNATYTDDSKVTVEGLQGSDALTSITLNGQETNAGEYADKIVASAAEIGEATGNYTITYVPGKLKINKKAITITADSDEKVYDGSALTKDSYTSDALAEGDSFESVTVTGSQINVGKSDNTPSDAKIVNTDGEDVTASYTITYAEGSLEVTPKALTITADSDSKVYDGTPLTKDSYTNTALATGDTIESVTVTGSQTVVGKSDNVPSAAVIKNAAGADVTDNYTITYANGTLEVTKNAAVIITADSDTKEYDGTALTKGSYQVSGLATGDSVASVTVTGSQTIAGESENVPSAAKIVNAKGEDVTASYEITYANGTLKVTPKAVTITADSDTKVYDGKALTKDSFTNTTLAEGDTIESVTVTGSQTIVGKSNNVPSAAKIVNTAGEDVTASYTITYANGTLEVTKKAVTITADSAEKVYDGAALTKDSYTNTDLAAGDKVESVTVNGSQTIVGSSENVPSAAKIVNTAGEDVTASYEISYVNGILKVTPKTLTITADSAEKVYDGKALTKDSYTNSALAEGDRIDSVTVKGSQTVVGTASNIPSGAKIVNAAGEDVTTSYEITYANGTLKVTKKTLTITAASDSKVYDGTALTKNEYTKTDLADGDTVAALTITGSQIDVGKSDNVPSAAKITNTAGEDVTDSYDITYAKGTLEVTKKALTIKADSATKIYDGTPLTKDTYTATALAEGDTIKSVTVTGSQTVVGSSDNVPSDAVIKNAEDKDVTGNYEITYEKGTLEVTKNAALIITADSDTKVYDGTALTKNTYQVTGLAEGDKVESVTVTGSQTIAGESDNVPSAAKIVNAKGEDVTASYTITYKTGTLKVTPMAVTITAGSDTKVYDGTALTKNSYTKTDIAEGDSITSVTVTGSQTVVGTSENVPSAAKIVNAAGEDVTASYTITYANGTLEVTPKAVTITADSDEKVYDGTALTKNSYQVVGLAEGDKVDSVTVTGSQTIVGKSDNVPTAAKIVNAAGEDVTASYTITYANGSLEVTPKAVTITADSDTKVYDGTALTKNSYTNTALATGDKVDSVTVTGSQTIVGKSNNVPTAAKIVNAAGEDVTASYEITYANGTLEVTKKALTITAASGKKVYDGTALTKNEYTKTALAEGDEVAALTITGSQIDVGTSDNVPSEAKITNAAGEDVTASYEITYANGTLEVTKKALTITADSATKIYDGTPLTKDTYTASAVAEGDKIESVTVTGSQTVVGSSDNVPSDAVIKNADKDVTGNYDITYVKGTLEVTKNAALIITADSDTKVYDGTALTKNSYQVSGLAEGDEVDSVTVTGSQTVAGESENVPSAAKIVNAKGEDVTASYTITYKNGTLKVTPKAVTITAGSDTKVYDGTALTKNSYTKTDLAEGDTVASVTVTGSQTIVGKSDNVPSAAKIVNAAGEDVTESYTITYANGTLEVTPKAVTITADSDTKVYDGTALTKDSYTNTDLAEGDKVDSVTVTGSQTVVGTSDNVPSAAKIVNAAGEDVTTSYDISYANGTLEVTKKTVTITADSDSKVYDGTALTKNSFTNTALAAGDKVDSVLVTGSQTVVGTSNNVPSTAKIVNAAGVDVTTSYEITYANGTLEVTKKDLTITADSASKVYDGTALTKNSYTNTALAEGDTIDSVTVTGSQTVVGKSDNVPSAAKIVNADGVDVTESYNITYAKGTLTVTSNEGLTITADSATKVYDGTALTKDSYQVTGLAQGDSVDSVTITGSQTIVGKSENVPSAAKIVNAAGEDVTASYTISYVNGALEVTKKAITITADSDKKVYDGTALTKDSYTNDELAAGDKIDSVKITGSQTIVGKSNNVPSAAVIKNAAGEDVTTSYEITYANGTLEVTPKTLTITADSDTKVYDGTALTKDSYTNTDLAAGDKIDSVTVTGSQTVVGSSDNVPSAAVIKNVAGEDVTTSYEITYVNGSLEVTKKALTITADSATKVYDGTALTKDTFTNTDLAAGDKIESVTVTGSQTVVGSSDNVPSDAVIKNAAGADVTGNYEITYANGTLEVTKNDALIITADSDTKVYDGTALTKDSYQVAGLAEGDEVESVTVTGSQTTVGKSDNVPSEAKIVNAAGEDVTASYEITYQNGTLEVTKKAVTITADSDSKVYDGTALTKDSYTNTALATGESIDSVTVTGTQTLVGSSDNVPSEAKIVNAAGDDVTANYDITYVNGTLTVTDENVDDDLVVTKTAEEKAYALDEKVTFTVTATNIYATEQTITLTEIEGVTLAQSEFKDVEPGATIETTATYTITQADILAGSFKNTVTAKVGKIEKKAEATVETEKAEGHLTIKKETTSETPEGGYPLGATIEYKITVLNDGNLTITDITVTDELTKDEWTVASLAPGASKEFTAEYVVTEADVLAGEVVNVATGKGTSPDPDQPDVPVTPGEDPEPTEDPNGHLTITKVTTSEPANGEAYALDEVIEYKITVLNDGNLTITDITVTDELTKDEWKLDSLAPGESKDYTTSYTVTEADVLAGEVVNVATGKGTSPDPDKPDVPVTPGEDPEPTEDPNGHLTVEKVTTSETPEDGYPLGATISYEITVKNDGNLTITDITVSDELTNGEWKLDSLAPGASEKFTTEYVVTEADVLAGEVLNVATAKGTSPDPDKPDVPVTPGEDPEPTEDPNGHLTITKETTSEPANGETYALDEEISYKITVLNDGNLTITDITVTDELTKDEWTIASLAPGASKEFETTYTVTEADILAGEVVNVATGKGTSPDPDKPDVPVDPGEDPEPTEDPNGHLKITKVTTSEPANGETYALDEEISYKITVLNDGNLTITDITVTDELTKDEWTITSLAPGTSEEFETTYKVTEADILAGEVLNVATAKGTSPDPEKPDVPVDPGEDPEPTEDPNGHITITKETTSEPANGKAYVLDEVITYKITVENDGNLTITDITVTDELTGDEWTIASLAPKATEVFETSYTVTKADVLAGEVVNVATGKGKSPDPDEPDVPVEPGEDPEPTTKIDTEFTFTAASDTKQYDGTPLTNEKWTLTDKDGKETELPNGYTAEVTVKGEITNSGDLPNEVTKVVIKNADGEDITDCFSNIKRVNGKLEIIKRDITLTSASAEKPYDGKPLTRNAQTDVTIGGDGLADTDQLVFDITGSQTLVGESDNEFTYTFSKKDGIEKQSAEATGIQKLEATIVLAAEAVDLADNYNVTTEFGTLKVTDKKEDGETPVDGVVTKTHDGDEYALGDTITFEIEVTNIYDAVKTITLVEIEGMELSQSVFEDVPAGEIVTATATHVVTEEDILNGSVKNEVTAKFSDEDTEFTGEDEAETEDPNSHATIVKKVVNEKDSYTVGDTIEYEITITNDGNMTLTDIIVTDELTEDEWEIKELAPGESQTFTTEYKVTEEDADAGSVKNVATATGESIDPDSDPEIDPGDVVTPIAPPEKKEESDVPKTGDTTDLGSWVGLMVASLAGAGCTMIFKRKKEEEE